MTEQQAYNHHIGMSLDEFVSKHKGIAFKVANKYRRVVERTMDDFEDCEQICLMALVKAYHNYNPDLVEGKKAKPTSYATHVIKGAISNHLRDKSCIVRYPREFSLVWSRMRMFGIEDERDVDTVAKIVDVHPRFVKEALKFFDAEQPYSFQAPANIGGDDGNDKDNTLEDHIGRYGDFSVIYVNDFMNTLSEKERNILELILQDKNQGEIAKMFGYKGQSQISVIKKRIADKLKEYYAYVYDGGIANEGNNLLGR